MITSDEAVDTLRATVARLGPYRIHSSWTCHKEYKANLVPTVTRDMAFKLDRLYEQSNGTETIYKYKSR